MTRRIIRRTALTLTAFLSLAAAFGAPGRAADASLDHVYVIVLENRSFDDALFGPAPFLRSLAQTQGLATWYFGVAHPSLPNYLAMIAGDDFGVRENRPSCLASDLARGQLCHLFTGETLVDQLESRGLTWAIYAEDLPEPGSMIASVPAGDDNALYVQKHNPFAYFEGIARNRDRLQRMRPLAMLGRDLQSAPPNVSFIVPNQCNDGHGSSSCTNETELVRRADDFLRVHVEAIRASRGWSDRSAIIVTYDEGTPPPRVAGSPALPDCCAGAVQSGGHHVATVVISKCGMGARSAEPMNHYSLLATIEDGFGLPRLRKANGAATLTALLGPRCGDGR